MTNSEKMVLVEALTDESDEDVVSAFLSMAGDAIYHYVDPFEMADKTSVLERYGSVQVRAAAYFLNKRGADGEQSHSENGISRVYESGDLPASLLQELTPRCGVIR